MPDVDSTEDPEVFWELLLDSEVLLALTKSLDMFIRQRNQKNGLKTFMVLGLCS